MIRVGDYRVVMQDIECNALIADPPYGDTTHSGHDGGVRMVSGKVSSKAKRKRADPPRGRQTLSYGHWTPDDVREFVEFWAPRTRGWMGVMSCSDLASVWRAEMKRVGRYSFAPVPCIISGMTVRLSGDGPSSWAVYLNVSRPRSKEFVGGWTRPGGYWVSSRGPRKYVGGKPPDLMSKIVGDYSLEGDLVCDPCAGYGTTGLAALKLGRRFVGAEVQLSTALHAADRIEHALKESK